MARLTWVTDAPAPSMIADEWSSRNYMCDRASERFSVQFRYTAERSS